MGIFCSTTLASREYYINLIILLSILLTFTFLIIMRKLMLDNQIKIDRETLSPSDFCLIGNNLKFKKYELVEMEKELREYFDK